MDELDVRQNISMKHYIILLILALGGFIFFSFHESTTASRPDTAQAAVDNTVRIISTLSWLGAYVSVCVGVIAHWLHKRLDIPNPDGRNGTVSTSDRQANKSCEATGDNVSS